MSNFGQLGSQMLRGAAAGMALQQRSEDWSNKASARQNQKFNNDLQRQMQENDLEDAGGSMTELARRASEAAKMTARANADKAQAKVDLDRAKASKLSAEAFKLANSNAATAAKPGTGTVNVRKFDQIGTR